MAISIKPKFRDAVLGETYYTCEVVFTGIATGYAKIIDQTLPVPDKKQIDSNDIESEVTHFWSAYAQTVQKFEERLSNKSGREITKDEEEIINTIRGMIRSQATDDDIQNRDEDKIPSTFQEALKTIRKDRRNADFVVYEKLHDAYSRFKDIPSMEKTAEEFRDILNVFLQQYDPEHYGDPLENLHADEIPIYSSMSHGDVANLVDEKGITKVRASIVDHTTLTSHAVLNAKSHNLLLAWFPDQKRPANIQNGTRIIVDGNNGVMILGASDSTWEEYKELERKYKKGYEALKAKWKDKRIVTSLDKREFKNYINGDVPSSALAVEEYGAQGMGLVRLEGYLASLPENQRHLTTDEWYRYIDSMVQNADRGTFVFRLLDATGDKAMKGFTPEVVAEADKKFITAFLRYRNEHSTKKLELMVPNVRSSKELQDKQSVVDVMADIEGVKSYKLGSMDEHPDFNEALEAGEINASFLSTGSNDMTTETLNIDRFDEDQAKRLDQTHPDVLRQIHWPLTYQRKVGGPEVLPVSICGDMASQPQNFALLTGMGYRRFSMAPAMLPVIKELQNRIDTGYRFRLLKDDNPAEYKKLQKNAQKNDNPTNAWSLLQRIRVEPDREKRTEIITRYNETYLGLDSHNRIDPHWVLPKNVQKNLGISSYPIR